MYETHAPGHVVRKILLLSMIGFLVVMLSGPILAVLSVVLSLGGVLAGFALVGFLVWLPVRMVLVGREQALANARDLGAGLVRDAGHVCRRGAGVISWPLRLARGAALALLGAVWFLFRAVFTTARFAVGLAFLTAVGAGLGAVLGVGVGIAQGHNIGGAVLANTLAGAAIAAAVALVLAIPRPMPLRQAPTVTA